MIRNYFHRTLSGIFLALLFVSQVQAQKFSWEESVVLIDVKRKQYDYFQPWTTPMQNQQKCGVVIGKGEILTTAEGLSERVVLRVQKEGRGKWFAGEVLWVDYYANLAVVGAPDEDFWKPLKPVGLMVPSKPEGPMHIARWRTGKLERRLAEFNQFAVEDGKLSYVQHLQIEVSSEIAGAGWSEPLVAGEKLVGLVSSQNGNVCKVIPAGFVDSILKERTRGKYRGLGYFDFVWQTAENPSTLNYLKVQGDERGVIVTETKPGTNSNLGALKPKDVILEIDSFTIDSTGDYKDPDYGFLNLEFLATRSRWAGDIVKMKIIRDGQPMTVNYTVPKVDFEANLVPDSIFDQPPEYFIAGGLVFQPLSNMYLRSWGADWRRRAPFRLNYYNNQQPTKERSSLVLLSQVLPDPFNLGYQEYRFLVIDEINGQKITDLESVKNSFNNPHNGFHIIKLMKGDNLQKIVLDAAETDKTTQRVLGRYGIDKPFVIVPEKELVEANK